MISFRRFALLLGLVTLVAAFPQNGVPKREQVVDTGITQQLFEIYQKQQQSDGHVQLKRSATAESPAEELSEHSTSSGSQVSDTPSQAKSSDVDEDQEPAVSLRQAPMNSDDLNCNPNESRIILRCITCTCDSQGIRESCTLRTCGL